MLQSKNKVLVCIDEELPVTTAKQFILIEQ